MVRVALADDHTLVRNAFVAMIDRFDGYHVAVQAGNGMELIAALRNVPPVDIAIVDLHMPLMDGYATIDWIRTNTADTHALALTFEQSDEAAIRALRAGACGFLLKSMDMHRFKHALDQVSALGHYHSDEVHNALADHQELRTQHERKRARILEYISERERTFIHHVCDEAELTYEQIADRMHVHRRTVDGYRESLFAKFHIKSKCGLVLFAYRWGILDT